MKKKNALLVTLSWILTILSFIVLVQVSRISTSFGSPASSPPYLIGLFSLPALSWLITYLTARNIPTESERNEQILESFISSENADPELKTLKTNINKLNIELNQLKKDGDLLNKSLGQNLITQNKYNVEMDKLDLNFYSIHHKKVENQNRIKAIIHLSEELKNLEALCDKGIINSFSKESKRSEMIDAYLKDLNNKN